MHDLNTTALRIRGAVVARPVVRGIARGVTLIELLIAIVLLVGMTAIVLPNLTPIWNEQSFTSGVDRLRDLLLLARAEAQAGGRPVEVRWDAGTNQVTARRFIPELPRDVAIGEPFFDDAPAQNEETIIPDPWATLVLPVGVHITRVRDDDGDGVHDDLAAEAPGGFFDMGGPDDFAGLDVGVDAPEGPVSLALFLPDGSVVPGVAIMLADDHGRQKRCVLNAWTGLARFEDAAVQVAIDRGDDDETAATDEADDIDESGGDDAGSAFDTTSPEVNDKVSDKANDIGGGERDGGDDAVPNDDTAEDDGRDTDAADEEDDS